MVDAPAEPPKNYGYDETKQLIASLAATDYTNSWLTSMHIIEIAAKDENFLVALVLCTCIFRYRFDLKQRCGFNVSVS